MIGFTGPSDPETDVAYTWNQTWFGTPWFGIKIDKEQPNWDFHTRRLQNMFADDHYDGVIISGHGNVSCFGAVSLKELKSSDSDPAKFFRVLSKKLKHDATIEIRACQTCTKDNHEMLKCLAELCDAKVTGYTDWYAVEPHGDEYTVDPDGNVEKTGEHGDFEKSIWNLNKDKNTNQDKNKP